MTAVPARRIPALARPGFDRSAEERTDPGLLDRLRGDPSARVLVIRGDRAVLAEDGTRLRYRRVQEVPEDALWAFLGRTAAGVPLLLAARAADAPDPDDGAWAPLRVIGGGLDAADAAALVTAVSLGRWLRDSPFCPSCGARTAVSTGGWARTCPDCGREHFPRTDPAVIVAVGSENGDRLLLGSNALWDANRFSCFAGFVEAGESAEGAVARELREEAGVRLREVRYGGSQAWPYPRSLMLGFHARVQDDAAARADGDEIAAVRWFTRAEIGEALERGQGGSGILLPGPSSIAHALISDWHAERS